MLYEMNNFKNRFDKRTNDTVFCTWDEVIAIFSTHEGTTTKDYKMYNFCTLQRNEVNEIHCISENVLSYNCLVLDYDDKNATIEWAINEFDGFTYLGYTSYNHHIKGVDKFRLIFPFATPCPVEEWNSRKEEFIKFAGPVDRSTIATSRVFYMPSCAIENLKFADSWHCEGALLEWDIFPAKKFTPSIPLSRPIEVSQVTGVLDELLKYRPVLPNEERYWIARAVARCVGVTQATTEMQCRWPDANRNGKYKTMLVKLKKEGPDFGAILKMVRRYNPDYGNSIKEVSKFKLIKGRE